jgi:hypothetical protein
MQTQAYHLTWADLYYILTSTLPPDEHNCIGQSAQEHANQLGGQNPGLHSVAHNVFPLPNQTGHTNLGMLAQFVLTI